MFQEYCKINILKYKWGENNEFYINSGVTINNTNNMDCIYNLYSSNFPKSKKVYANIKNIVINNNERIEIIDGEWKTSINVIEEMYNRENIKFETTTKIENVEIKNIDISPINTKIDFEIKSKIPLEEKNNEKELIEELLRQGKHGQEISDILSEYSSNNIDVGTNRIFNNVYIETLDGQKFYQDFDLPEGNKYIVNSSNNIINATVTLALTKYELTDLMYLYFEFEDEQYKFELIVN